MGFAGSGRRVRPSFKVGPDRTERAEVAAICPAALGQPVQRSGGDGRAWLYCPSHVTSPGFRPTCNGTERAGLNDQKWEQQHG